MRTVSLSLFLMLLVISLPLLQCSKEAPPAPAQEEKPVAPAPAPAVSAAEFEALEQRVAELEGSVARLDEARARIVGLEEQLGYVKSGLNNLEKRPIPAAEEPTEEPAEEPTEEPTEEPAEPTVKPEEPVAVEEPVPTEPSAETDVVEEPDEADVGEAPEIPVGDVGLVNMKFATQVDRDTRKPVNENTVFSRTENRLYCWLVLSNMAEEETQVRLFWKREGQVVSDINLRVGKHTSHWRTWAYIKPHSVGQWEVELQDMSGRVFGSGSFTVE